MKLISKGIGWMETENPFVDSLSCPWCEKAGAILEPRVVLVDGPEHKHVNIEKVNGKLLTMQGHCPSCRTTFLWRVLIHERGTFQWADIGTTVEQWNTLLEKNSDDQLPCLCKKCVKAKGWQPENPLPPPNLKNTPAKKPKEEVIDAEVVDDTATVSVVQQKGMALTLEQHTAIAKALKVDWATLGERMGCNADKAKEQFIYTMESYVRIKFATFQPQPSDSPDVPPRFPTIVPKSIFAAFKASGEAHLCEYVVTGFAVVDQVLGRSDLPASIIYHHMCRMCKVSACKFHPSKREED